MLERQEIKPSMALSLSSIKAMLLTELKLSTTNNVQTSDVKTLSEQTLYLNKAAEFSAELFTEIHFKNNLDPATSIHWHGLRITNAMDGVPGMIQAMKRLTIPLTPHPMPAPIGITPISANGNYNGHLV